MVRLDRLSRWVGGALLIGVALGCDDSGSVPDEDAGSDIDVDTDADSDTDTETGSTLDASCSLVGGACVPEAMCAEADRVPPVMGWQCCEGWVCCEPPPEGVSCEDVGGECNDATCPPEIMSEDGPLPCADETQVCCMPAC